MKYLAIIDNGPEGELIIIEGNAQRKEFYTHDDTYGNVKEMTLESFNEFIKDFPKEQILHIQ